MTTPSLYPSKFAGSSLDFNKTKQLNDGGMQMQQGTVSVPSSTASGTVIGLVPFRKGFSFSAGSSYIYTADLDTGTSVTFSVGYVYDDNTTYTNAASAFASAVTTPQSGGAITLAPTTAAAIGWVADADGWIAITTGGGSTTTTGSVSFQICGTYSAA